MTSKSINIRWVADNFPRKFFKKIIKLIPVLLASEFRALDARGVAASSTYLNTVNCLGMERFYFVCVTMEQFGGNFCSVNI